MIAPYIIESLKERKRTERDERPSLYVPELSDFPEWEQPMKAEVPKRGVIVVNILDPE